MDIKLFNTTSGFHQHLIVIITILGLGFLFQYPYLTDYPNYIHAWAQTDRYALALGFLDNNFKLFHPETYILNLEFSNYWLTAFPTSITAVDFPIHEYIIALLMKLLGTTSPWVFRLYTLIYSFFGLFFLYKLSYLLTKDFLKSLLVVIFTATSSVFVYYQGGFLPSMPSLCNVFIGLYFYIAYFQKNKQYHFNIALLFLTLATLNRTSFLIPLIAVLGFEFLRILRKETSLVPKILPVFISLAAFVGYFLWNAYLRNEYASLFLSELAYSNTFEGMKSIISNAISYWKYHYFSNIHYYILLVAFLVGSFFSIKKWIKKKKTNADAHSALSLWIFASIWLFGCLLFVVAMMRQFIDHDYYFLDSFFSLILFLFILLLTKIPILNKWIALSFAVVMITFSIPMTAKALKKQETRRNPVGDSTLETMLRFDGAAAFLDSLGVDKSDKLLVFGTYPPNMSFIFLERKGYYVPMWDNYKDKFGEFLSWDYDYIVLPIDYYIYEYQEITDIFTKMEIIANNGKILVAKSSDISKPLSVSDLLDLNKKNILLDQTIDFDTIVNGSWGNTQVNDSIYYSGKQAGVLEKGNKWGVAYRTKDTGMLSSSQRTVLFSGYFYQLSKNEKITVTLNIELDSKPIFQKTISISNLILEENHWEKVELLFLIPKLPQAKGENYEFVLHVSSFEGCKNNLYYDDIEVLVY